MLTKIRSTVVIAATLYIALGCKARQGSNLNEISSGTSGSGDSSKNCEELFYEVERYQPKFNESFEEYTATQCELVALSESAQMEGKSLVSAATPATSATGKNVDNEEGRDVASMKLTEGDKSPLESLGMTPDPKFVQLVDPNDPAKTAKCKSLKAYLEEKTVQLASLKTEIGKRCSKTEISNYMAGKREYKIIDHPTCGYFSRCDDAFSDTNGVKCSRCWLDTYQQKFAEERAGLNRAQSNDMKRYSSLTCSTEQAARDAVELFCNNVKKGSCSGASDPKIKCETVPARDRRYEGPKELSGGAFKSWDGTEQSYQFSAKWELHGDVNASAGATGDAFIGESSVKIKTGVSAYAGNTGTMSLRVKNEVGLFSLSPPAMVVRGGVEEGALNTKFSCGIEVMDSQIEMFKDGVSAYVDVTVESKAVAKDPTGITNNSAYVGVGAGAGGSAGFDRAESKGLNKYRAFQSQYLSGAGMTKEGMQQVCDRYNAENMNLILSQFLSSDLVRFSAWKPNRNACREDKDCPSQAGGWSFRCETKPGQTVGRCAQKAYYGMSCPDQTFSSFPCDKSLGCKLKSWTSFAGWKFNRKYECWNCAEGKDAEGYCNDNKKYD